ncbi:MAG: MarR family transcriptional regulator [Rhizobacter sp.]|nr:MarR family transcriptional regulator [Rhizobacter sp.]
MKSVSTTRSARSRLSTDSMLDGSIPAVVPAAIPAAIDPSASLAARPASQEAAVRVTSTRVLDQSRLAHLVGYAATRASVQLKKEFARHMASLSLKAVEFSILMLIASNDEVNQKQLGRALDVSAPNLAVILDKLVERGIVERIRSQQDRREQFIHLTAAGREMALQADLIARDMEREAVAALSEGERLMLIELLHKVAKGTRRRIDASHS